MTPQAWLILGLGCIPLAALIAFGAAVTGMAKGCE